VRIASEMLYLSCLPEALLPQMLQVGMEFFRFVVRGSREWEVGNGK